MFRMKLWNTIDDIDAEVGKGVGEAPRLPTVIVDTEVAQNEALEGGVDVEGTCFMIAKEVILQCQQGLTSRVAALFGDVLLVRGDGAPDPRLDEAVYPVQI
jgi:hypothetical protein